MPYGGRAVRHEISSRSLLLYAIFAIARALCLWGECRCDVRVRLYAMCLNRVMRDRLLAVLAAKIQAHVDAWFAAMVYITPAGVLALKSYQYAGEDRSYVRA